MSGIDPVELRTFVIAPALAAIGLGGAAAEEIMTGIALQESGAGRVLVQKGGPALGIWQMEPETFADIEMNFLAYRPELAAKIKALRIDALTPLEQLRGNLYYACAMARIKLFRSPDQLPAAGDLEGQAAFYVKIYNAGGKATTEEYIANWRAIFLS